jgi:hypothetical protein
LPAKQTTRHIKQPELPEGGLTIDGRIKVRDNNTGRVKYLDAKLPMSLDAGGDLTHEKY